MKDEVNLRKIETIGMEEFLEITLCGSHSHTPNVFYKLLK